jgi:hypothetical protein
VPAPVPAPVPVPVPVAELDPDELKLTSADFENDSGTSGSFGHTSNP